VGEGGTLTRNGAGNRRLIQFSETEKRWMSEKEVLDLITENKAEGMLGVGFVDVTDHQQRTMVKRAKYLLFVVQNTRYQTRCLFLGVLSRPNPHSRRSLARSPAT